MNKVIIKLLLMITILGLAGCGVKKESAPEIIGGADEPTTIILESEPEENKADNSVLISGTWVTASMGYEYYGETQAEYYVQFTDTDINYLHKKSGSYVLDHSDKINNVEEIATGRFRVQAETSGGNQYTYQTSEGDKDILEYYDTWNEDEFSDMYRGGALLTRLSE